MILNISIGISIGMMTIGVAIGIVLVQGICKFV